MAVWTGDEERLIRAQVERMAASPLFAQSGRMSSLLRYLVNAAIAGTADDLNQYRIAIDVMGRDARFDPALDSIVRVEIGRLRSKLVEFYATEGAADAVRVNLPKGRYRPSIELDRHALSSGDAPVPEQNIRYCQAGDGTSLAYAISGRAIRSSRLRTG